MSMRNLVRQACIFLKLAVIFLLILVVSTAQAQIAKNIILMIGDGMGNEQVKAGSFYLTGAAGGLCFQPYYKCQAQTYSANSSVTDSAAAGTAIATGYRVNNDVISQAPDGTPYETILEKAKSYGKRTGLVTTVGVTHATPATFGAHEPSRSNYIQIGNDYLYGSQPNVIFGGGDPARGGSYLNSSQVSYAQSIGYQLVYTTAQMNALNSTTARALGLFAGGDLTYEFDRSPSSTEPHLREMTAKALELLSTEPNGFFLMVEGGKIDHACHSNDITRATLEVVEFHNAVQVALNWMAGRNDTLLIVGADHETGGLTVTNRGAGTIPGATWTTTNHTGATVPYYFYGAGADLVYNYMSNGTIHLIDVFKVMDAAIKPPTPPISSIRNNPDGTTVSVSEKIVTAGTDQLASTFYIQDTDRSSGIKVYAPGKSATYGSLVNVIGTLTTSGGERQINCSTVTTLATGRPVPKPLSFLTREVWGGGVNEYDPGVTGGVGLNNTGLLVEIWGRVTMVDTTTKKFYVDDGCGLNDGSGNVGLWVSYSGLTSGNTVVPPEQGSYVKVKGISSRRTLGSNIVPVLRVRTQSDITVLQN